MIPLSHIPPVTEGSLLCRQLFPSCTSPSPSFVRPPPLHHQAQGQSPGGDHPLPEPSLLNLAPPAPAACPPPSVLGPPPLGHLCLDTGLSKPLLKFRVQKVHSSSGKDCHLLLARLASTFLIIDSVPLLSGLPWWPGPQHHTGVVYKGDAVSIPCFALNFSVFHSWGLTLGHLVAEAPSLPKDSSLSYLLQ